MNNDIFWQIIGKSRQGSATEKQNQLAALNNELMKLSPEEIIRFKDKFDEFMDKSYTWDLWGAAYVIMGGCGDDGFDYFRSWLISMGKAVYEKALADAESLAEIDIQEGYEEDLEFEEFMYVAYEAYKEKTRSEMPSGKLYTPREPTGEDWGEDEEELARRFPKLSQKFGG